MRRPHTNERRQLGGSVLLPPAGPAMASAAVTPLTILGTLAWWVRADLGITIGTGVSAWADQSGNNINFSQGTGANQPALIAGAINGQPSVRSDGVNDILSATWARTDPVTQPFYIWLISNSVSWTANDHLVCDFDAGATIGCSIRQRGVSPAILMQNTAPFVNSNTAATIGTYVRIEAQFTGSVADYLKIISTNATGASAGTTAGGGTIALFGNPNGTAVGNVEIAEAFAFLGTPTVPQRTSLDAYCTSRYGAGLV